MKKEDELDRIIDEVLKFKDDDYIRWVICWLSRGKNLKKLKMCNTEAWENDSNIWENYKSNRIHIMEDR